MINRRGKVNMQVGVNNPVKNNLRRNARKSALNSLPFSRRVHSPYRDNELHRVQGILHSTDFIKRYSSHRHYTHTTHKFELQRYEMQRKGDNGSLPLLLVRDCSSLKMLQTHRRRMVDVRLYCRPWACLLNSLVRYRRRQWRCKNRRA